MLPVLRKIGNIIITKLKVFKIINMISINPADLYSVLRVKLKKLLIGLQLSCNVFHFIEIMVH